MSRPMKQHTYSPASGPRSNPGKHDHEESHHGHYSTVQQKIYEEFFSFVNMSGDELKAWLSTKESQESLPQSSFTNSDREFEPERIVEILKTQRHEFYPHDFEYMAHLIEDFKYQFSASDRNRKSSETGFNPKNWGHDPKRSERG